MFLLITAIIIGLLVTLFLPLGAGLWLTKRMGVTWRIIIYGVAGFLIAQLLTTLGLREITTLLEKAFDGISEQNFFFLQVFISIFLAALFGVLIRWGGMKFLNESLDNLAASYGVGMGYGGTESIMLVGLPLWTTFLTMLFNLNLDPQTTTLEPQVTLQLEALWQVPFYVPLAVSVERIASLVMHITVTILILQVVTRRSSVWLAAAFSLEFFVNGIIAGLSHLGLMYGWVILISIIMMIGNLYLLYRLHAFEFGKPIAERELNADLAKPEKGE